MMTFKRDEFEKAIDSIWAKAFDLSPNKFQQDGITIQKYNKLKGEEQIHVYKIGKHIVIRCSEDFYDELKQAVDPANIIFDSNIANLKLANHTLETDHIEKVHYLFSADFKPYTQSAFPIQQLSAEHQEALEELKSACTQYEFEDSWVSATDELSIGAFDGDKLVACASMYDWQGFADPGVLVHPDYRKRGLGKATISAICEWVLAKNRIMDYRCNIDNVASASLAESLGFTQYHSIEVYKVINHA